MLDAQTLLSASVSVRKSQITNTIEGYDDLINKIRTTKSKVNVGEKNKNYYELLLAARTSAVINTFIDDYIDLKITSDKANGSVLKEPKLGLEINRIINIYKVDALENLVSVLKTKEESIKSSKNLYEMFGATNLACASNATREISTTMGLLWEKIANISPYAVNPELEFGIKVKGIDLISKNIHTNEVEYQQLKTQKNTLTGSQKSRSIEELTLHQNSRFCACFLTTASWTFNSDEVDKVVGDEFWSIIGISYGVLLAKVEVLFQDLETEYVQLIAP